MDMEPKQFINDRVLHLKYVLSAILASLFACMHATAQHVEKQAAEKPRILIAYFSATGTTARAAEKLAQASGGELYAVIPAEPYTGADLDWHDKQSRCSVEMNDPKSRPAIGGVNKDIGGYDAIFIGYPIWWGQAPRIINTFIEKYGLKGRTVIPFATSGGSGITGSVETLIKTYPDLNWKEGKLLNRADERTVRGWIEELGY